MELKVLSDNEILELVVNEHNSNKEDDRKIKIQDLSIYKKELNKEFKDRAVYVRSGNFALRSGIESRYVVEIKEVDYMKIIVKQIRYNDVFEKKNEEIIKVDYI